MHRCALLGVEASLDAVVYKSHEACRHNNTVHMVSSLLPYTICLAGMYLLRDVRVGVQDFVIRNTHITRWDPAPAGSLLMCLFTSQAYGADVR